MSADRGWCALIVLLLLPVTACESKADREAHDKEVFEQGRKQGLVEGEANGLAKARDEAAKVRADAEKAAADKLQAAKSEIRAHPSEYLMVISTKWMDKPPTPGFQQISGATLMNRSAFALQVRGANVTYSDDQGALLGARPVMISGVIAPDETKVFSMETGTLATAPVKGAPTTADLQLTDLEVLEARRAP